jgi:glycosyltransferase involved in cell wall biosynthesis
MTRVARDHTPLVTIVIPTRNRRTFLPHVLESIANQDYSSVETVIVNDAESVRDIAERFGAVLVERDTPIDHAAAWNAAIERARGEYVAFVDDDDLIFPDHISTLVDAATRSGAAAVQASSVIAHRGNAPGEFTGFSPGCLVGIDMEETLVNCPTIGMIGSMVRRDVFTELGPFDSGVTPNDDYEMILRIALKYDWVHADCITYVYTREGGYDHLSVKTKTYAELYEASYKRHPFPDRPVLAARRRQFIEQVRANGIMLNVVSARLTHPTTLLTTREPKA